MPSKLSLKDIQQDLPKLDGWSLTDNNQSIEKSFKFKDFDQAWNFMSRIADLAKEMDHHPKWTNSYSRVVITLTTHDVGGISELDFAMAKEIDTYTKA